MALLGRRPVPPHRLAGVLRYPLAIVVHKAQVVLSVGVSLLSGLPVPPASRVAVWHYLSLFPTVLLLVLFEL